MRNPTIILFVTTMAVCLPALMGATFSLELIDLGNGQIEVISENIPGGGVGDEIDMTTNFATWTPVITNITHSGWATNTFQTTNSMLFYRARVR